jgi:hypothetical protein
VEYKVRLDTLVRRQIIGWKLSDGLLVDVHLRLNDELPCSPTSLMRKDPAWFDSNGMVYGFELIDPDNRMLVHAFCFQVFYHADEETLLVARAAHVAAEGI